MRSRQQLTEVLRPMGRVDVSRFEDLLEAAYPLVSGRRVAEGWEVYPGGDVEAYRRRVAELRAVLVGECPDHWHCVPDLASHRCRGVDRSVPCPTCGEKP